MNLRLRSEPEAGIALSLEENQPKLATEHSKEALMLTAAELQVPEGVFKQHDGTILGPLRADQVGPHAEGVVLVDEEDSHAVLKLPTPVTQKGLAVLVLATKENANVHEADPMRHHPGTIDCSRVPLPAWSARSAKI